MVFSLTLFYYDAYASFSGEPAYNDWYIPLYNVCFTALPVIALGVLDQDVSAQLCLKVITLNSLSLEPMNRIHILHLPPLICLSPNFSVPFDIPRRCTKHPLWLETNTLLDTQWNTQCNHYLLLLHLFTGNPGLPRRWSGGWI